MPASTPSVFWLGGSTFSGKTTISAILAERHGCRLYACDDHFGDHAQRVDPDQQPTMALITRLAGDQLFRLPPDILLAGVIAMSREEFPMIRDDIETLCRSDARPILVDGAALLPDCLAPALTDPNRAIWLVATESFIRDGYRRTRGDWMTTVLAHYRYPDRALANWLQRDIDFAAWIRREAHALGVATIDVDGTVPAESIAQRVAEHFCLPPWRC